MIIHSREAAADTMEIMKQYAGGMKAVIHCYSYLRRWPGICENGYYIGVGGVVTFKNARRLKDTVKEIPLESLYWRRTVRIWLRNLSGENGILH